MGEGLGWGGLRQESCQCRWRRSPPPTFPSRGRGVLSRRAPVLDEDAAVEHVDDPPRIIGMAGEWVTMQMVEPSALRACSIFITSSPCAVPRLPVGSSATISFGAATRARSTARAAAVRRKSRRRRLARWAMPTLSIAASTRCAAPPGDVEEEQRKLDILADGELVDEIEGWKTKPMFRLRKSASFDVREVGNLGAVEDVGTARRAVEHADHVEQGGLAAAGRAHDRDELAVGDVEEDAVERRSLRPCRSGRPAQPHACST